MAYQLTHEQNEFRKAYRLCMGSAPDEDINYFFEHKDIIETLNDYRQEHLMREGAEYWTHIEDAWLLWCEAVEYARKPPIKTYKVKATYSCVSECYVEAESIEQAYAIAKESGDFDGTIDHDDWQIENVEEVTK